DVEAEHARLGDRAVVATFRLAVPPQRFQLAWDLGGGEEVARVPIASDEAQGPALAHTADQDRGVGSREALRRVERSSQGEVVTRVRSLVPAWPLPHAEADLKRLFEDVQALPDGGEGDAQGLGLRAATGADAQPGPAA